MLYALSTSAKPLQATILPSTPAVAEKITYDHFWQKGDLLLVDNFLVMHGRRPFFGTRKVLASLAS